MPALTFHDEAGRITGTLESDADTIAMNQRMNVNTIPNKFDANVYYVRNGVAVIREANPAVLSGLSITNLPNPSTVVVEGTSYTVTDGRVDLTFDQPGPYTVRVQSWPYLNKEFTVENPAP